MKCIVLGLGLSGKAAALYLKKRGERVLGVDRTCQQIEGIEVLSESDPIDLKGIDLVVKSPGILPNHPWVRAATLEGIPIVGEIDLAFAELKNRNKEVLGITGSNGKTTTTLMAAHLLNQCGKKALAAGNIGIPLIEQIEEDAEVFVVELSSFQLENIVENPVLDGAVILNMTPNHLDRHSSFEEYAQAKLRIASCLKKNTPLYLSRQGAITFNSWVSGYVIFDLEKEKVESILPLSYRDNLYPHDLENVSAAFALTRVSAETLKKGMATFIRPPHRMEFVSKLSGIAYINDSKATSVDAVIKAVQALEGPIILIAGGVDKGGNFADWLPFFRGKVVKILALGQAAKRIKKELSPDIGVDEVCSLEEGVSRATHMAKVGTTVLLSPGCSSYDQFRDYQHRGETFRHFVNTL